MELNKIIKYGEKFGDVVVILENEKKAELSFSNRKISRSINGESVSLEIRISNGKKFGYASTTNLDNWKKIVDSAVKIMRLSRELKVDIPVVAKKKIPKVRGIYSRKVESLTPKELFSFGEELLSKVNNSFNVPNGSISAAISETKIANSDGINLRSKESSFSSFVEVSNSKLNTYGFHTSHKLFDVSKVGKEASDLLKKKLGAKKIKSFKGDVIFGYFAVSDLFERVIIPAVLASNIQSKKSVFAGRLGEKIFSEKITIIDNGILPGGLFSSPFDGEGEPRKKTTIFRKGVLNNFLYDNYSAKIDGVKSTGNSDGIDMLPKIAPTNFIINKGKYKDLISKIDKGLFVRDIVGTHLINPITGDCSVGVDDAFYIENGEIKFAVKQAMLGFNLFDALRKVELIGNKIRQEGNVASPDIVFEDIQVIG